ncbi:MAG: hypothetical protein ACTSPQ_20225 [Candidatus Helarchaeota archaeon]
MSGKLGLSELPVELLRSIVSVGVEVVSSRGVMRLQKPIHSKRKYSETPIILTKEILKSAPEKKPEGTPEPGRVSRRIE